MSERWAPIVGFEGRYEVSTLGRVRALTRGNQWGVVPLRVPRIRAIKPDREGYMRFTAGRAERTLAVDRCVLEAFVGPAPAGHEAGHLNGDRSDCRLANLRWCTDQEQADRRDAIARKRGRYSERAKARRP